MHFTGIKFARASQLVIFMMVCSQYLIFTSPKFCAFVQIRRNIKPAKNCHLKYGHACHTMSGIALLLAVIVCS